MAYNWETPQKNQESLNRDSLFFDFDLSSFNDTQISPDFLFNEQLIDPALEKTSTISTTEQPMWDWPEKLNPSPLKQRTASDIKPSDGQDPSEALGGVILELRQLTEDLESRLEKTIHAVVEKSIHDALEKRIHSVEEKVNTLEVELESEVAKFSTELDANVQKLRGWAIQAKLYVDKVAELHTD